MAADAHHRRVDPVALADAAGKSPAGENVFRNYGMLDEFHNGTNLARMIERMDAARREGRAHGRRQRGRREGDEQVPGPHLSASTTPSRRDIMRRVRELDHYVRNCGFVCLRIEPFMWREGADRPRSTTRSTRRRASSTSRSRPRSATPGRSIPSRDRAADLHRRGGARLPRAAHHVRRTSAGRGRRR